MRQPRPRPRQRDESMARRGRKKGWPEKKGEKMHRRGKTIGTSTAAARSADREWILRFPRAFAREHADAGSRYARVCTYTYVHALCICSRVRADGCQNASAINAGPTRLRHASNCSRQPRCPFNASCVFEIIDAATRDAGHCNWLQSYTKLIVAPREAVSDCVTFAAALQRKITVRIAQLAARRTSYSNRNKLFSKITPT